MNNFLTRKIIEAEKEKDRERRIERQRMREKVGKRERNEKKKELQFKIWLANLKMAFSVHCRS